VEGSDPRPWLGLIEETRLQKPARNASLELFGANGSEVLVRVNLGGLTLTALNRDGVAPGSGLAPAFVVDFNVASVSVQFSSK
jgi:hypothetical protein